MKKILGLLLGAGSGVIGTLIRTGLAALGGVLVTKGYIDQDTANNIVTTWVGAIMTFLAALGSYLNNEANK
jgi:hypothetical protein